MAATVTPISKKGSAADGLGGNAFYASAYQVSCIIREDAFKLHEQVEYGDPPSWPINRVSDPREIMERRRVNAMIERRELTTRDGALLLAGSKAGRLFGLSKVREAMKILKKKW